jgi:hypothetical protein
VLHPTKQHVVDYTQCHRSQMGENCNKESSQFRTSNLSASANSVALLQDNPNLQKVANSIYIFWMEFFQTNVQILSC